MLVCHGRVLSRRLVKIPCPKFVVFYNGVESQPDYQEMRLSDCFIKEDGIAIGISQGI